MASAELDPDRKFVLDLVPEGRRPAVAALWRLDATLAAVLAGGREPHIARIKLAWWRDALEALDHGRPPAEPVLQSVAGALLPMGITGAELALMEEGWAVLLSDTALTSADLALYAAARGGILFRISASLLGREIAAEGERAGGAWALVDLARHSNRIDAAAALAAARQRAGAGGRWPRQLRPLGMLAILADRDSARGLDRLELPGTPPRIARMLRHRLTGR